MFKFLSYLITHTKILFYSKNNTFVVCSKYFQQATNTSHEKKEKGNTPKRRIFFKDLCRDIICRLHAKRNPFLVIHTHTYTLIQESVKKNLD